MSSFYKILAIFNLLTISICFQLPEIENEMPVIGILS